MEGAVETGNEEKETIIFLISFFFVLFLPQRDGGERRHM